MFKSLFLVPSFINKVVLQVKHKCQAVFDVPFLEKERILQLDIYINVIILYILYANEIYENIYE